MWITTSSSSPPLSSPSNILPLWENLRSPNHRLLACTFPIFSLSPPLPSSSHSKWYTTIVMRRKVVSDDHQHPCLHCHPHSYIRMVQHLIERCLLLRMTREDCVEALAKHAGIKPVITLAVWKELMRENRGFFHAYFPRHVPKAFLLPPR